jgi:hypothetical protein
VSTRRIAGIIMGTLGITLSVGHLVLAFFAATPERDHGHTVIVGLGLALTVAGILLIGTDKQR